MRIQHPGRSSRGAVARRRPAGSAPPTALAATALGLAVAIAAGAMHGCGGGGGGSGGGTGEQGAPGYPAILSATGEEIIIPLYEAMASRTATLESSARGFCTAPTASALESFRGAWRDAIASWLEVTWIEIGPIKSQNRRLRIHFWPDANNNVRRSVDQLLARSEPLTEAFLSGQTVAGQGFPALELLLFDPGRDALADFTAPETGARRCDYAVAIAANLSTIADELVAEWRRDGGNFVDQLALAGNGSTAFASPAAAVEELINVVVSSIEQTKNDRLGGPLGADGTSPRPERAESRPSGNSLPNVIHAVEGLRAAISGASFDVDAYLRQIGRVQLADRIRAEMDETVALASSVSQPLAEAVTNPDQADELAALFDAATRLTRTLKNDLSFALGVTIGFNMNDGD
jgi:predicted lipoprotein